MVLSNVKISLKRISKQKLFKTNWNSWSCCSLAMQAKLNSFFVATLISLTSISPSFAQSASGKWDAKYQISLSRLNLGEVDIKGKIDNDKYEVRGDAKLTGLIGAAFKIKGGVKVNGQFQSLNSPLASAGYNFFFSTPKDDDKIVLSTRSGNVTMVDAASLPDPLGTRVPIKKHHKKAVSDPITAFILPAKNLSGSLEPIDCKQNISIFDGRERYDIKLSYKRMEQTGQKRYYQGYHGSILVCKAQYHPIAGHRSDDELAAFSARSNEMEVWLAPVVGTRRLFPFRFQLPTPYGMMNIEAAKFETSAKITRHSALIE